MTTDAAGTNDNVLVEIKDLHTYCFLERGTVRAVDGVSLTLARQSTLGVVGESGCGKSVTAMSIMRLVNDPPGRIVSGEILLRRTNNSEPIDIAKTFSYKSMMFSDVPNLVSTFGYINASWTLKSDLTAEYSCRLLNHMAATGARQCTPRLRDDERGMAGEDWIANFSSGYIQRKMHLLPRQGTEWPWLNTQNYASDRETIGRGPVDDEFLQFS